MPAFAHRKKTHSKLSVLKGERMSYDCERRTILGAGLKMARKRAGLSAKKAVSLLLEKGLPCTRGTLLAWERGGGLTSREPFASDLTVLASAYGCSVQDFFGVKVPEPMPEAAELQLVS
jgi:transcriptional regulator with XRE-family HTH domain